MIRSSSPLERLIDYFSGDPEGVSLNLIRHTFNIHHPMHSEIMETLTTIDANKVEEVKQDKIFQFFYAHRPAKEEDLDRAARTYIIEKHLAIEIPRRRLSELIKKPGTTRMLPYTNPALSDLKETQEQLVPLSEFEIEGSGLFRNETGFTLIPSTESLNSQYWLIDAIRQHNLKEFVQVRLDPLIVRPKSNYTVIHYFMLCYGKPLNWDRLKQLKSDEHSRFMPSRHSTASEFTDLVWSPRDNEIHFQCEELPKEEDIQQRGSRYMHAIYNPSRNAVTHLDAGIRIFNSTEWGQRKSTHVRNAGKVGSRIKIFRINKEISPDILSDICASYFVWNNDVARYFGADIPEGF